MVMDQFVFVSGGLINSHKCYLYILEHKCSLSYCHFKDSPISLNIKLEIVQVSGHPHLSQFSFYNRLEYHHLQDHREIHKLGGALVKSRRETCACKGNPFDSS
jgi:hypothetical protein